MNNYYKMIFNIAISQLNVAMISVSYIIGGRNLEDPEELKRHELIESAYSFTKQAEAKLRELYELDKNK